MVIFFIPSTFVAVDHHRTCNMEKSAMLNVQYIVCISQLFHNWITL
jgi:hypothetical protein